MKKNIYLTILAMATIASMIFGVLNHITGLFHREKTIPKTEQVSDIETDAAAPPDTIEADMDIGSLILRAGDAFRITYEGEDDLKPTTELKDGTLSIRQKKDKSLKFGIHKNETAELTVTLPEETALSKMQVDLNLGTIRIEDLQIEKGSVQNDLGDIEIHNCGLGEMDIDVDAGDLAIGNCAFRKLDIDQDLGDVDISSTQDLAEADIEITMSFGTLRVNGTEHRKEFSQKGNGEIVLRVNNDMGDIDLQY